MIHYSLDCLCVLHCAAEHHLHVHIVSIGCTAASASTGLCHVRMHGHAKLKTCFDGVVHTCAIYGCLLHQLAVCAKRVHELWSAVAK